MKRRRRPRRPLISASELQRAREQARAHQPMADLVHAMGLLVGLTKRHHPIPKGSTPAPPNLEDPDPEKR